MCEFCVRHGDGQKWYLNAANYSAELLHDVRRAKYVEDFLPAVEAQGRRWLRILDRSVRVAPSAARRLGAVQSRRMKKIHFGQVLPIEDVEAVLGIVGQVTRLPCVCRKALKGEERGTCYALAVSSDGLGLCDLIGRRDESRFFVDGMDAVSRDTALREMAALEEQGVIHTVWTFLTPFIGAICNCDPGGCLAMNFTERGLPLYLPGEERIAVDHDLCTGCGACVEVCLFGALTAGHRGEIEADGDVCRGCGICRRVCPGEALRLVPRDMLLSARPHHVRQEEPLSPPAG